MRDENDPETRSRPHRGRVVVVGAGLAGTATVVRLLQFAVEPVEIVLVERRTEFRGAGPAYHPQGNPWHHVFNIQAGRMSVFRENVDDFLDWANTEADRSDWPEEWKACVFQESSPAPRRMYAGYLARRLERAVREANRGVTLSEVDGEVVDLDVRGDGVVVLVQRATELTELYADYVVLATGPEVRHPDYADAVLDHPAFIQRPYTGDGVSRMEKVAPDAVVAVVGTLLSAYDFAAFLLREGHTGDIRLVSRSNLTPRTYPADHRHRVLAVPRPRIGFESGDPDLVTQLKAEWDEACRFVERNHPHEHPAVTTERVAKAWEAFIPEIIRKIPAAQLRTLLAAHASLVATLRVGAMSYTTNIVDSARHGSGQVQLVAGRVTGLRPSAHGGLLVTVTRDESSEEFEADLVIAGFGRQADYSRTRSPLWRNLLDRQLACPHRRTMRGVEVDGDGALLAPNGRRAGRIAVVGAPREGDELVRHGRTGAFGFNLAAIKNHSVSVAATALRELESRYVRQHKSAGGAAPAALRKEWPTLVRLEIRRLAACRHDERDELRTRLDARFRDIVDRSDVGTWRCEVNRAAVEHLTDVSVTPRQLRSRVFD